jgi:C1A family cysteine protease
MALIAGGGLIIKRQLKKINYKGKIMDELKEKLGMGWLPDYPDIRDYTPELDEVSSGLKLLGQEDSIKAMLTKLGVTKTKLTLPPTVDLRAWCSPIENQGALGSCTANAGVGILEYFEKRAYGKYIDASRLFLYKVTRDLLHWTGDTGAFIRTTMGAMVLFGVPLEAYWPYVIANYDIEPSSFLYAFAQNYQALSYYRLDPIGITRPALLNQVKTYLAAGLPSMFGFTVYNSYTQGSVTGKIPFPAPADRAVGGHAIVAVGYDDNMKIRNTNPGGVETTGALLFRNSWGTGWGSAGYGWLPYEYIIRGLAVDWWSLLRNEWVDTGQFGI